MKQNLKVNMTFEALDLELEILNKSQQQIIMGGSDGSSNGDVSSSGPHGSDPTDLLNQLFYGNESPATFSLKSDPTGTNPSTAAKMDAYMASMTAFATTPGGAKLLWRIVDSGMHIDLDDQTQTAAYGLFNYSTSTMTVTNILSGDLQKQLDTWSHELFHALDSINGGVQGTTKSEFQAFTYQNEIEREIGLFGPDTNISKFSISSITHEPIRDSDEAIYQQSGQHLVQNGWDLDDFNAGMKHFKNGSYAANQDQTAIDLYKDLSDSIEVLPGANARQLIADFLHCDNF